MVRKVHLHSSRVSKFFILICWLFLFSCSQGNKEKPSFIPLDLAQIPLDTVDASKVMIHNGIVFYHGKMYSGYTTEHSTDGSMSRISSYLNGQLYGLSRTYYAGGIPKDIRSYRQNLCYGRHLGYWENGKPKFDYFYVNEKREGIQKQWYRTGAPARFFNYRDDKEEGMQRAWRENGKLYVNYEARDGIRYGLQKSALCYTVKNKKK